MEGYERTEGQKYAAISEFHRHVMFQLQNESDSLVLQVLLKRCCIITIKQDDYVHSKHNILMPYNPHFLSAGNGWGLVI